MRCVVYVSERFVLVQERQQRLDLMSCRISDPSMVLRSQFDPCFLCLWVPTLQVFHAFHESWEWIVRVSLRSITASFRPSTLATRGRSGPFMLITMVLETCCRRSVITQIVSYKVGRKVDESH